MINQEEIKSQDDVVVNQGGRSSDVLVATIEKCEKLEIQNKILKKAYRKNPERMTFKVKSITYKPTGLKTDLNCQNPVFDIELGERVK